MQYVASQRKRRELTVSDYNASHAASGVFGSVVKPHVKNPRLFRISGRLF